MNHSLKIMGLCVLVALVATSCQKNEEVLTSTFTAELNQPTCEGKTHLVTGDYLVWDEGDQVAIFDLSEEPATVQIFTATSGGTTHTTFAGDGAINANTLLYAFYPAGMVSASSFTTIDNQTYVEGSFAPNTYPMACTNGGSGTDFLFQGMFGVLAIPLTGNCTIGSVDLTDADMNLKGTAQISLGASGPIVSDIISPKSGSKDARTITLTCEGGLTLTSTPKKIMFVVRPGALYNGFTVTFKDLNDEVIAVRTAAANMNNMIRPEYIVLMPTVDISIP